MRQELIQTTPEGLYCTVGNFHIDPWRAVERAVLTHAHADHAYRGSASYLVATAGQRLFRTRLGETADISSIGYGTPVSINGVRVSLHPAGHVLGSAQIRLEYRGEVWVVSGDFKLAPDPTCAAFEPVRCHRFITEATFGLPIYRWPDSATVAKQINSWWQDNKAQGKCSILTAYALGKAQRLLASIDADIGPVYTHGATERLVTEYRLSGIDLPMTAAVSTRKDKRDFNGALVLAPPSALGTPWLRRFGSFSSAFASGWMLVRGSRRRKAVDRGFVVSDHADWDGLLHAIAATSAERIYVTHGFIPELVRYLREQGQDAQPLQTLYRSMDQDIDADEPAGDPDTADT